MANIRTVVCIPKDLLERVNDMARAMKISRSRLVALALEDYLERRNNRRLLEQINAAYSDGQDSEEERRLRAAQKTHRRIVEGEG